MEILGIVIFGSVAAFLLSFWAHLANDRRALAIALYIVFGGFAAFMLILGTGILAVGDEIGNDAAEIDPSAGWPFVAVGLAILISMLPPTRFLLSRVTPMDARSIPDMVGLVVLAVASVTMFFAFDLAAEATTDEETVSFGPAMLVLQGGLLVVIAYFGIGGLINRDLRSVRDRLGLHLPSIRQVLISFLLIVPLFFVSAIAGALTQWLQPEISDQAQEFMGDIGGDMDVLTAALLIGITAGIGEEILFRGAIQPRYGLIFTSIVFALIHVQYGFSFLLLGLFVTSIIFGIQRIKTNTTCCIITHAAYNFTAVMLTLAV